MPLSVLAAGGSLRNTETGGRKLTVTDQSHARRELNFGELHLHSKKVQGNVIV